MDGEKSAQFSVQNDALNEFVYSPGERIFLPYFISISYPNR